MKSDNSRKNDRRKLKHGTFDLRKLFPAEEGYTQPSVGGFSVNTFYDSNRAIKPFNSKDLLTQEKKRMTNILRLYDSTYNDCCDRIRDVNKRGTKDMVFSVVRNVTEYPEYNSMENLKNIEKELEKQLIDTYIFSDTDIFITWNKLKKKLEDIDSDIDEDYGDT